MSLLKKIFGKPREEHVASEEQEEFHMGKYEVPEEFFARQFYLEITLARPTQWGHFDFLDYEVVYDIEERKGVLLKTTQEFIQTPLRITDNKNETPLTRERIEQYLFGERKPLTEYPWVANSEQEIPKERVNSFCAKELCSLDVQTEGYILGYFLRNLKD